MHSATRSRNWRAHQRAGGLILGLMGLTLGCRDENESPTAPDTGPAIATAAAQALSFRQVSGGWDHTCGVTTGNQAYCWGKNAAGQLGNGSTAAKSLVPVLVTELDRD